MGDYAFDGGDPPPILKQALNYSGWGVNIDTLPAGQLVPMNVALNVYNAVKGYLSAAGKTTEWTESHPDAWEIVSKLIAIRKGIDGNQTK